MEEATEKVATLDSEIKALVAGIGELDKDVKEATDSRKQEHEEYTQVLADNANAKEIIMGAQNRLAKFYAPAQYTTTTTTFLDEGDRIYSNFGSPSFLQEQAAVFAEVREHNAAAPPPPPETWGAYEAKGEEHTGVTEMLNLLKADLDKDTQSRTVDETEAQAEYEKLMADSAAKREADAKSVTDKESAKADLVADLEKMGEEKKGTA